MISFLLLSLCISDPLPVWNPILFCYLLIIPVLFVTLYPLVHLEVYYHFVFCLLILVVHHHYHYITCTICKPMLYTCVILLLHLRYVVVVYLLLLCAWQEKIFFLLYLSGLDSCLYALSNLDRNYNTYQMIVS